MLDPCQVRVIDLIASYESPMTALSENSKSAARAPTMSYLSRRLLNSKVKQALTDHQQYVAPFWRIDCTGLSCP